MKKLRTEAEFMALFKGVPTHKVSQVMNSLTPGINWHRCSKSTMAERWSTADPASLGEAKAVASAFKFTDKQIQELARKSGFRVSPDGVHISVTAVNGGCTGQVKRLMYHAIEAAAPVAQAMPRAAQHTITKEPK